MASREEPPPRLYAYMMKQDDPRKCSSERLSRLGLVKPLHLLSRVPRASTILDPFSPGVLGAHYKDRVRRIVVIDCSWRKAEGLFPRRLGGLHLRLPLLVPTNPVSYGKVARMSSAEALAAALFILGFEEKARAILAPFGWGPNFFVLNLPLLEEYRKAEGQEEALAIEEAYFGKKAPSLPRSGAARST